MLKRELHLLVFCYFSLFQTVLDLCNPNPCHQDSLCHSTEDKYICACPEGYYDNECLKKPCTGQNCPGKRLERVCVSKKVQKLYKVRSNLSVPMCAGAMADMTHGGVSFYMVLVGVIALVVVCGCAACAFILSHLHRKRKKQQAVPQEEGINNQREFVNLIRNVDRPVPLMSPTAPLAHPPANAPVSRCYEEIELTLPPSPVPSHSSPALKPAHAPKLDISNREREKLNRFHYTDNQELEVWPSEWLVFCVLCALLLRGPSLQVLLLYHSCGYENGVTLCPSCNPMAVIKWLRCNGY